MGQEGIAAARELCEVILARHSAELVELTLGHEHGVRVLRVTLDRLDGPVVVEELTRLSEEISRALDAEDPIDGRYTLEVASAGLERPLVRPSDYLRFEGREIKVRCFEAIEGRKNFNGIIRSSSDSSFVLESDSEVVEIPYVCVARAQLVVDWAAELRGGAALERDRSTR